MRSTKKSTIRSLVGILHVVVQKRRQESQQPKQPTEHVASDGQVELVNAESSREQALRREMWTLCADVSCPRTRPVQIRDRVYLRSISDIRRQFAFEQAPKFLGRSNPIHSSAPISLSPHPHSAVNDVLSTRNEQTRFRCFPSCNSRSLFQYLSTVLRVRVVPGPSCSTRRRLCTEKDVLCLFEGFR